MLCRLLLPLLLVATTVANLRAGSQPELEQYFKSEVARLEKSNVDANGDWAADEGRLRSELAYMLGLDPMPPRGDLKAVVTKTHERNGVVVDNLHFQPVPGLYVAANFYRPKVTTTTLPAVLYVCGHKAMETKGVKFGNKAGYSHHGVWFAQNGYACLVVDTIQLGEFGGHHHGTHQGLRGKEPRWWWNSRGYTPAGVEAWTGIRAIDYLVSRPEVDAERIGVTGRSGGGGYSWTIAALDQRVKVVVPVAGITDTRNHVIDGAIDGHCDCMFYLNAFQWDYWKLAALCAPRPTLLINTDSDAIFPLDGVQRLHAQVKKVYAEMNQADKFGLAILPGKHTDTQDQQVAAFRWFNRHLKGEDAPIPPARSILKRSELKVFDKLPADEIVTTIDEKFVPMAVTATPTSKAGWESLRQDVLPKLTRYVFAAWPEEAFQIRMVSMMNDWYTFTFKNAPSLSVAIREQETTPTRCVLRIETDDDYSSASMAEPPPDTALVTYRPRFPEKLSLKAETQMRRRFMMVGQTLDGMRVYDIRRAIKAVRSWYPALPLEVHARGFSAVNTLYASLFDEQPPNLVLHDLPKSHMEGPDYLNVLRIMDIPHALGIAQARGSVIVHSLPEAATTDGAELRDAWMEILGPFPERAPLRAKVISTQEEPDHTRKLVHYQVEPGVWTDAYLLIPKNLKAAAPAAVVFHATSANHILQPVGLADKPTRHLALEMVRRGYVTLSPRCYIYGTADTSATTAPAIRAASSNTYQQAALDLLARRPEWTGMGKMLWDGMRAVDYLETLPQVDKTRIVTVGHSLGAKEALYLAAFDERVAGAISSEGGLGLKQSNWDAIWYLGKKAPTDRDHDELLKLAAPRAVIIMGGGASDGEDSRPLVESARPAYETHGKGGALVLQLHGAGHDIPAEEFGKALETLERLAGQ